MQTLLFSVHNIKIAAIVFVASIFLSLSCGYYICWTNYKDAETIHDISDGLKEVRVTQKTWTDSLSIVRREQDILQSKNDSLARIINRHVHPPAFIRKQPNVKKNME